MPLTRQMIEARANAAAVTCLGKIPVGWLSRPQDALEKLLEARPTAPVISSTTAKTAATTDHTRYPITRQLTAGARSSLGRRL